MSADEFIRVFRREMHVFPAFRVPPDLRPVPGTSLCWSRGLGDVPPIILLTAAPREFTSFPVGAFVTGFAGYGINSNAFFLMERTPKVDLYFRLPFGNAHGNVRRDRRAIVRLTASYGQLRRYDEVIDHLTAWDSMRDGLYRLRLRDGSLVAINHSLLPRGELTWLLPRRWRRTRWSSSSSS